MLKFLTFLFSVLEELLRIRRESKVAAQEREEVAKEVEARVEKAEAAVATPDAERDERLRSRFDRSRNTE